MRRTRAEAGAIRIVRPSGLPELELHVGTGFQHSYPRHWHDGLYVGAITAGSAAFPIRGTRHPAGPGALAVLAPGEVHGHEACGGGRSFRTLHADAAFVAALAPGLERALRSFVVFDVELVRSFLAVHRILERSRDLLRRESRLAGFLGELSGRTQAGDAENPPTRTERAAVARAKDRLDESSSERVSLRELASLAGMSPFHFHRVFLRQIGLPPHEYLIRRRLVEARARLRRGEPAAAVAAATGFADQSHLTRHFKRLVGLPPAAYAGRSKNVQDAQPSAR